MSEAEAMERELIRAEKLVRELDAEVARLRKRTHEIQEAADKRNAELQSAVEKHKAAKAWAHMQLEAFRKKEGICCESVFDRLCILNLRDEWQSEIAGHLAEVKRLQAIIAAIETVEAGGDNE